MNAARMDGKNGFLSPQKPAELKAPGLLGRFNVEVVFYTELKSKCLFLQLSFANKAHFKLFLQVP